MMKKSIIVVCLLVAAMLVLNSCTSTGSAPKKPNPGQLRKCGNGVIGKFEMCDDGSANTDNPNTNCYGGTFSYCSLTCTTETASCDHYCGDGVIDAGEGCDGTNLGGESCISQGFNQTGSLTCNPDCSFNFVGCI